MKKKTSMKESAVYNAVLDCVVRTFGHPSKPELSKGVRARSMDGGDCQAFSEALDLILPATFQDRQSLVDHFLHFDEFVTFQFEDVIRDAMFRLYGSPDPVRFAEDCAGRFANPDQSREDDYSPTGILPPMVYAQTIGITREDIPARLLLPRSNGPPYKRLRRRRSHDQQRRISRIDSQ